MSVLLSHGWENDHKTESGDSRRRRRERWILPIEEAHPKQLKPTGTVSCYLGMGVLSFCPSHYYSVYSFCLLSVQSEKDRPRFLPVCQSPCWPGFDLVTPIVTVVRHNSTLFWQNKYSDWWITWNLEAIRKGCYEGCEDLYPCVTLQRTVNGFSSRVGFSWEWHGSFLFSVP